MAVMRPALLLSGFLAACSVGEVPLGDGGGVAMGSDAASAACVDRKTPIDAHLHASGGTANAGNACLVAACHLPGAQASGAPQFQFAGTLYKTGGTTANPGATIRVTSGATTATAVSDTAGNFYIEVGILPAMPFPATTNVTACPTATPMSGQLVAGIPNNGNCNTGGCHAATMPITLADQ